MSLKEYKYRINGVKFNVGVGRLEGNSVQVTVNGTPYTVEIDEETMKPVSIKQPKVAAAAPRTETGQKVITKPATVSATGGTPVKSPLPGTIMSFAVKEGDSVKNGQTVCVLEAMKMENDVHTPVGGTVKKILVNVGDAILEGTDIMIIE